ncbi:hypothetical protein Ccrd_014126 [Cynara cardunculus var. scolymus]|uniref:Glycoside hydrolase, catalytic domain-containing protein n=1 Tax=Cynara cardunculus var. scolymus TaxID=59895 RepID=A0A103YEE4_CYNCS|nr:hypothetical protein Ccrd_014126 [Cynara cardunculus var. scolymus]
MEEDRKRSVEEEWNSMNSTNHQLSRAHFPPKFLFGVATSAYQVEGAANLGGRGPCIWDKFASTEGKIKDGKDGVVAVDQYHRYKEDVDLIVKMGFSAYRFSISWSRIYPDGLGIQVNNDGIMYYNNLINYLLERGIEPCVTLYHWDLPLHLDESMEGWLSDSIDLQGGEIGLVVDCEWAEALTDNIEDITAAARRIDFQLGWLGDLLPVFSDKDKDILRNSVDFVGLNHYTSRFVSHKTNEGDNHYYAIQEKLLNYVAQRYNNPPIHVTENGMDDEDNDTSPLHEMLDDKLRVAYFKGYLASVSMAIKDGVDVRGYFAWSLVDNFEWQQGYTKRFGLVYVDYKNGLARHLKSSAYWFMKFLKGEDGKNGKED